MFTKITDSGPRFIFHLFILVTAHARPCFEGGDFESCFLSKASINDDVVFPDVNEQFNEDVSESAGKRHKYEVVASVREMRGISEDFLKNCSTCEEDAQDVVDREDHITQYLAEFLVNTDSEITSLEASDVEETRENYGSSAKDDGFFAFLTGEEKVLEVEGAWSYPARTIVEESEFA